MANYIITGREDYFRSIGEYNYTTVEALAALPQIVACDTETPSLEPQAQEEGPFALQLGTGKDNYLLDMETVSFEEVRPYLEDKVLIFHNAAFDLGWMYWHWNFFPRQVGDTMLASMILHNGRGDMRRGKLVPWRHGFGYVMERELGLQYDKGEQKNIARTRFSTERAIQYMFNDVDRLLELHADMVQKLAEHGQIPTYRLHRRYIRALAYMEQCGLPVSTEHWMKKMEMDKSELEEREKEVVEYIYANCPDYQEKQGDLFSSANRVTVNLSSPQQMIPIFESFGIKLDVPDEKDKTQTKKSIAEEVLQKTKHPFVDLWLSMQEAKHNVQNFGQNLLVRIKNEAFYTKFKPCLDTARIATRGRDKETGETCINIMNFPKGERTRSCFRARPGFQMVVADYEG
jgi:DNA polymerase I-like protein with 3'-5' exonuclease and polymerase domains